MDNYFNLERRLQKELISESSCIDGLVDISQCLFAELRTYLEEENRSFGIVTSYIKSLRSAYKDFNDDFQTEESMETLGKTIYLYKPLIIGDFRKLCQKRLSKADSIITLMKRITDVILEISGNNYNHLREVRTINKIITKLFDNIRNNGKNIKLNLLVDSIKKYTTFGQTGKYSVDEINFKKEEIKKSEKTSNFSGWSVDL